MSRSCGLVERSGEQHRQGHGVHAGVVALHVIAHRRHMDLAGQSDAPLAADPPLLAMNQLG